MKELENIDEEIMPSVWKEGYFQELITTQPKYLKSHIQIVNSIKKKTKEVNILMNLNLIAQDLMSQFMNAPIISTMLG